MDENIFFLSRDYTETLNMSESSSSAELSIDDKIRPSGSNEMRFVNSEEVRRNHCLCDERRCEKEYIRCITILMRKVACAKVVRYFMESQMQNLVEVGGMVA